MSNIQMIKKSALILAGLALGFSPAMAAKAKKTASPAHSVLKVDTTTSKLGWVGKKVTGQHNGSISIKDGEIHLSNGLIVGGAFTIDMTSLKVLDIQDAETNQKLVGHLQSDDFFGTAKNPTSTFVIKEVKVLQDPNNPSITHEVKGDLMIKGATHPLSFPAKIVIANGQVSAEAKGIQVDRTLYNIRYGSGKFFENLGDKTISDLFLIDLTITAK